MKTPEQSHWRRSDVLIVSFELISNNVSVFAMLTLNKYRLSKIGLHYITVENLNENWERTVRLITQRTRVY